MASSPTDRGVLAFQGMRRAVADGVVHAHGEDVEDSQFQPASLDLRVGPVAHRLRCSFLPTNSPVVDKLADYSMGMVDLREGAVLERNRPYLIPLVEGLDLPDHLRAKLSPKSSTGRLDIFTRVVSDYSGRFDEVRPGYTGQLYLELVSRTFTIKLTAGQRLNQLRILGGDVAVSDDELREVNGSQPVAYRDGAPIESDDATFDGGVFLGVDLLADSGRPVAYRARRNAMLLDLAAVGAYDREDYWEPVFAEKGNVVVLEPEEFYVMASAEAVHIPEHFASEMVAYDATCGELRTHYAGFFDPGFGGGSARGSARAVLEVRAHDVPFVLSHGQRICRLTFEHLSEVTEVPYGEAEGGNYVGQGLALGKHFRPLPPQA